MNQLHPVGSTPLHALVAVAGTRAQRRFREFFAVNIRNRNTCPRLRDSRAEIPGMVRNRGRRVN
jgi:hypothetical protein